MKYLINSNLLYCTANKIESNPDFDFKYKFALKPINFFKASKLLKIIA